jgi:hypothetical protein
MNQCILRMSSSNDIFEGYEDNNEINIKFELDYDKESELEQVINSTNEINISGSTSSDTPTTSSSSSLKLSSNSNSATNSLFLSSNNQKLSFCSSNSSLNTSFYEMNQVIDLTKNEYLAKTSLNSPNKYNFNQTTANIDSYINDTIDGIQNNTVRRSVRLAQLYNTNKTINEQILPKPDNYSNIENYNQTTVANIINDINLNCETHGDLFLSNALSIDTSDNFFKTINDITTTTTTATTCKTSTNDTCDVFLNNIAEHNNIQENILTNDFDNQYSHHTSDFNELLDKNFNSFVDNDLILETHRINNDQFNFTNNDNQSSFTLMRPNCVINENDYLNIQNNNKKHDVSIGTDLSISRDIRCKLNEFFF